MWEIVKGSDEWTMWRKRDEDGEVRFAVTRDVRGESVEPEGEGVCDPEEAMAIFVQG